VDTLKAAAGAHSSSIFLGGGGGGQELINIFADLGGGLHCRSAKVVGIKFQLKGHLLE